MALLRLSPLVIILATLHHHLPSSASASNPLCEHAMTGTFNDSLISVTWNLPIIGADTADFVLASFIKVPLTAIYSNSINMDGSGWWQEEYKSTLYNKWNVPHGLLQGYHQLCKVRDCRAIVLVVAEPKVKTLFIYSTNLLGQNTPLSSTPYDEPFEIIVEQKLHGTNYELPSGYIITRDPKGDLIIFQLQAHVAEYLKPNFDSQKYYYINRGHRGTKTISLIHRENRALTPLLTPPFKRLLPGFIKAGFMHLFDDTTGCVRIINIGRIDLDVKFAEANKTTLNFSMESVPYEKYFKCPLEFRPAPGLDPKRCDRQEPVSTSSIASDSPVTGSDEPATTEQSPSPMLYQLIAASLVIAIIVLGSIYLICSWSKKKRSEVKSNKTSISRTTTASGKSKSKAVISKEESKGSASRSESKKPSSAKMSTTGSRRAITTIPAARSRLKMSLFSLGPLSSSKTTTPKATVASRSKSTSTVVSKAATKSKVATPQATSSSSSH